MKKIVGITGKMNSGKDTCFTLLSQRINCKRVALADSLRRELNPFITDKFGIDLFQCDRTEKDLVRPLLVEYARIKRGQTNGKYFIDKVNNYVKSVSCIVVVTDIRYIEEVNWIKNDLNGILVHVSKYKEIDGKRIFSESPIQDERDNDPKMRAAADYLIEWPEVDDVSELGPYADKLLAFLEELK